MVDTKNLADQYAAVKRKVQQAQEAKLRSEGELTALQQQLDQVKAEAIEKFGTADTTELRAMADTLEARLSEIISQIASKLQGVQV